VSQYSKFHDSFNSEKIEKKEAIEKLFKLYNKFKTNEVVDEWVRYLSGYTGKEIEQGVEYCFNNIEKMPSFAQFKQYLPKKKEYKTPEDIDMSKAEKETLKRNADANRAKEELIKRGLTEEDIIKYTKIYWKQVCNLEDIANHGLTGVFINQALAGLARANMDSKRAIQRAISS